MLRSYIPNVPTSPERRPAVKSRKILKRERIDRALESIFDHSLTIVEAPMGYGKTTAVRNFLEAYGGHILWISFFSSEDTASFFWDAFSAQIRRLDRGAGAKLKALGFPSGAPQTANILSVLCGLEYEKNTVLVIDDFHFVKDSRIGGLLAQIARQEIAGFHIAAVTRDTSNLAFAELSAKGLCNVIPPRILRFTADEIRGYCSLMGFSPSDSDVEQLCEYTGGWISLIYLLLLGAEQGIPAGRSKAVDELVEAVLYNAYDDRIKRFLLRLSAMDGFTAEQALFVTQEARADEFLKKLRRENAFVTYDEAAGAYKIHNVLLDFLRAKQVNADERAARRCSDAWANGFLTGRNIRPRTAIFTRPGKARGSSPSSKMSSTERPLPKIPPSLPG
mgnify:CR=1 FL=1